MKMLKKAPILFAAFAFIISSSCASLKLEKTVNLSFKFEKTPCFGECPIYSMEFYDNGEVILHGRQFLKQIGTYKLETSPKEVDKLCAQIEEMDFCNFQDMYGSDALDFPSNILTYTCSGNTKTVKAISDIPTELVAFIYTVDSYRDKPGWVDISTLKD